ncbi:flagellar basal-body rod protein FlgF [Anaerosacchariphilus polymeriproducens]|uniref:Flagellar basal-body rod protein FlgF n=1 Tax=Anaerosacchariphilus polymeriproducens TaxID=1812858 RepID=A0A371AT58_9FIRM|nr:flagellar basal-body rod protein FlgF [Anaerosacchariphilus polymeriproducens]RDU22722.1 flagellar basal-body rod protein FlgF [Anaerosacchariphilus polymeriproducens]
MVKGLYTAYTGMINQQNRLDVITNNLANSATTGYKKEGTTSQTFKDVLAYKIKDSSEYNISRPLGTMSMGVKIGENYTDYGQGAFRVTDNDLDLALDGDGFFAISFTGKNGETSVKYTRDGSFTMNKDGYLVTKDGDFVLNQNGAMNSNANSRIQLDPNAEVKIDASGNIYQNNQFVAQIGVADFPDYNYIEKYGENLYQLAQGGTIQESTAFVNQGILETSNVNVVSEMVEMIEISRAYESNQKLIQTIDGTLDTAVNQLGKV